MKKINQFTIVSASVLIILSAVVGCGKGHNNPTSNQSGTTIADGAYLVTAMQVNNVAIPVSTWSDCQKYTTYAFANANNEFSAGGCTFGNGGTFTFKNNYLTAKLGSNVVLSGTVSNLGPGGFSIMVGDTLKTVTKD